MSHHPERRKLPLIAVYAATAAKAEQRVTELLGAAGASPAEVHTLIAAVQAGAVESAQGEVIELDMQAPSGSSAQVHDGWFRAVEAIADRLAHIADRTVQQARATAAALKTPSPAPRRTPHPLPTPVDSVGEGQVHQVLEAAKSIFVSLTGYTGFDRDLSEEILTVVLKCVSAEQQDGYAGQLGAFADESRCYLTHQPESLVVCERLDTVPMWLAAVWNTELDAELTLERFTNHWRYGLSPS
ncbi:hypothetical protein [Streptomyces doebereineriae]|uniref:Uncharacterized protein n=1 Tax=Streptomyces doebereineriae TaxID=3075528 RepID=A0ABU2VI24_9ACTN|nr:hypothetical protein [Streptomyces sp. DSM 41640]MDT0485231.1 hypothetical protein [Streptomyces sp. DSM 41640]